MRMTRVQPRTGVALVVLGLTGAVLGCGEGSTAAGPSAVAGKQTPASLARTAASSAPAPNSSSGPAFDSAAAAHLSPTELEARGWTCFSVPIVPDRIVCSRPNQGRPTVGVPPPAERPATFTFLLFDGTGAFTGTELLIRTDLYKGQRCESTRQEYVFRAAIGYYECVHAVGAPPSD